MTPRDPLSLQRQLAGLAALEAGVRTALRGLYVAYPTIAASQLDDDIELTAARVLVQLCDELLLSIDDLRGRISVHVKPLLHSDQTAWPF